MGHADRWACPEQRLMIANGTSLHVQDIVTGKILTPHFDIKDPVYGVAYSKKHNRLVIITSRGADNSTIIIIDAYLDASSASYTSQQRPSCFAFSQTTQELVCGMGTRGLELIKILPWDFAHFDFPVTITSVSRLSSGTVVANVTGSGIQLLSLDEGYTSPPQELIPPALTVRPFDKGRIIAVVPTNRDHIILVETTTMFQLLTIPVRRDLPVPTNRTVVLCASLEKKIAVYCFAEGGEEYIQLWNFIGQRSQWTVRVSEPPTVGGISPTCTRLVTFHGGRFRSFVRVSDMRDGGLLAELEDVGSAHPLDITFDSEYKFSICHDTCRIPYDARVTLLKSRAPNNSITRGEQLPLVGQAREREYCMDDSRGWVVSGSRRICWIPPGYIGSVDPGHCWAGSSLVMAGQDGTLRKLTFRESSL